MKTAFSTAFITGASSGIGRALALELAGRGTQVAIAGRRVAALEQLEREIAARAKTDGEGGRAVVIPLDVSDPAAVEEAIKRADAELGSLDLVIANAGISQATPAPLLSVKATNELIDVNVRGAIATLVAAIPVMVAQQRGHLVGVSSLAGQRGLPGYGAYSASKAALSTFLETLRVELGPLGIDVTDVQPGFVDTPMAKKIGEKAYFMWPAERAAETIVRRLSHSLAPPVISFPLPLAAATMMSRMLPSFLFDPLVRALSLGMS